MKTRLRLLLLLAAAAGVSEAQNSDLGLLLGASVTNVSVSGRSASTNVSGGGQINYAFQLKETVGGRLYVELPVILTGSVRTYAGSGLVSTSVGDTIFFTPGVRWTFHPAHRLSVYAAAGGGLGSFGGVFTSVNAGKVERRVGRTTTGAFGFGLGLDFRLTRLVSLRGEYRDAITRGNLDGAVHHSLVMFGVGLHF
jgi:opacity protein-like surface antigen